MLTEDDFFDTEIISDFGFSKSLPKAKKVDPEFMEPAQLLSLIG